METGPSREKFVYEWRLDTSRVGDVRAGRFIIPLLPGDVRAMSADGAFDSSEIYRLIEERGARPIIKPRANARIRGRGSFARPRALRWRLKNPEKWQDEYDRRPITESVNYALKRRFGERLWTRGLRAQQREMAARILAYNVCLKTRWKIRLAIHRGTL